MSRFERLDAIVAKRWAQNEMTDRNHEAIATDLAAREAATRTLRNKAAEFLRNSLAAALLQEAGVKLYDLARLDNRGLAGDSKSHVESRQRVTLTLTDPARNMGDQLRRTPQPLDLRLIWGETRPKHSDTFYWNEVDVAPLWNQGTIDGAVVRQGEKVQVQLYDEYAPAGELRMRRYFSGTEELNNPDTNAIHEGVMVPLEDFENMLPSVIEDAVLNPLWCSSALPPGIAYGNRQIIAQFPPVA